MAGRIDTDPQAYVRVHRALDESVTESLLDAREREVRDAVREIAAHRVAPASPGLDRTLSFAHESYQSLAEAGLAGLLFPKDLGGSADSTVAYAAAMEEICAAARRCDDGQDDGQGGGQDGGYLLNGSKTFITTGDRADVIICFATTDRSARRDGVSAFVVEGGSHGLGRGEPLVKMGMHGSSTAELFFDDVRVPASNRLGAEGSGWRIVMNSVIKSRISAGAQGVGIARGAYAHALAELTTRHGPVLPAELASPMAELRGRMLQARLLLLTTAAPVDRAAGGDGVAPTAAISMMKQQCTDVGVAVALGCVRLLGAAGDLHEAGVERYLRDGFVTQIYDGTNEIQRMLIGRDTATRMREVSL